MGICPPCGRDQHEQCYNVQLADTEAGRERELCDCRDPSHGLMPEEHRELFTGALYAWLEANGVTFAEPIGVPPFQCTVDLNKMKIGMADLIRAFGGEYR